MPAPLVAAHVRPSGTDDHLPVLFRLPEFLRGVVLAADEHHVRYLIWVFVSDQVLRDFAMDISKLILCLLLYRAVVF